MKKNNQQSKEAIQLQRMSSDILPNTPRHSVLAIRYCMAFKYAVGVTPIESTIFWQAASVNSSSLFTVSEGNLWEAIDTSARDFKADATSIIAALMQSASVVLFFRPLPIPADGPARLDPEC